MADYKLDKTAFKMQPFEEADRRNIFDKDVPLSERLAQSWFLTSQAYGFSLDNPPKFDRTAFSMRKFEDEETSNISEDKQGK